MIPVAVHWWRVWNDTFLRVLRRLWEGIARGDLSTLERAQEQRRSIPPPNNGRDFPESVPNIIGNNLLPPGSRQATPAPLTPPASPIRPRERSVSLPRDLLARAASLPRDLVRALTPLATPDRPPPSPSPVSRHMPDPDYSAPRNIRQHATDRVLRSNAARVALNFPIVERDPQNLAIVWEEDWEQ